MAEARRFAASPLLRDLRIVVDKGTIPEMVCQLCGVPEPLWRLRANHIGVDPIDPASQAYRVLI